jgi:vancomycin resistance protein YoaR
MARTSENAAAARDVARRRPSAYEHLMTDLTDSEADRAANASIPDNEMPAGDPELAALVQSVRLDAPSIDAGERPRRRRSLAVRFGVSLALGFVLAISVGAGVLYAWGVQYDGRVLPGVRVGSADLGGLTREQADTAIANAYGSLGTGQITLTGPDGDTTTVSYDDIGRGPATSALVDAALAAGRHGEPLANLIGSPRAAIHGVTVDPVVAYDHDKLAAAIETLASTIDQTPVDAFVSAGQGGTFSVSPAKDGRAVDQAALLAALDPQLDALDTPASITMAVPVLAVAPAIATSSAEAAKAAADRMAADVVVTRGKESWTIDGTSLAPLVRLATAVDGTPTAVLDTTGLDSIVTKLAKKVDQKMRNAGLKRVGRHIVATSGSREGRTLIPDGMKTAIIREIVARQSGMMPQPVTAVVKAVDPKLSTADAKAFAPKMKVISSFSVFYWPIINNHYGGNIEAPATKINGTVVPPGGKFDFWKVVGDVSKLPGVGPGNAIVNGKITVTGALGGGICTTSTTLFNAALEAGMVPLARKAHSEYITRYPAGLDATVWIVGRTKQTMSFRNDTKYPILIQRIITNAGSKRWITFRIWSVPNGRTLKISNRVIQHGPRARDTIVKDPNKPVGYVFHNNAPADGAKVWVTVSIYEHGKLHFRKRYYSNYPAVNGVTVVGTKP